MDKEYRHITLPNGDVLVVKFDEEAIFYDRYNHNLEEHKESYGYDLYEEVKLKQTTTREVELESKLNKIQSDYNKPFTLMTYRDSYGEVFQDVCTNDPVKYLKRLNADRVSDGEETESMKSYTLTNIHIETFKNK